MRLIDADELMEHVWRDKLDSRELIAKMIDDAPTVKEISTKIPINVFERLISQEPKTGHWIMSDDGLYRPICDNCGAHPWKGYIPTVEEATEVFKYCPSCGSYNGGD